MTFDPDFQFLQVYAELSCTHGDDRAGAGSKRRTREPARLRHATTATDTPWHVGIYTLAIRAGDRKTQVIFQTGNGSRVADARLLGIGGDDFGNMIDRLADRLVCHGILPSYTGRLSCFLAGISTCLFFSIDSARAIRPRV